MEKMCGKKYLITTDDWFFAPNGEQYTAVWGTVNAVLSAEETLGIQTNSKSTNWYVSIGNMIIAGCQIHYAVKCDEVCFDPIPREMEYAGRVMVDNSRITRIYNADL